MPHELIPSSTRIAYQLKLACAQGWEDSFLWPGPLGHFGYCSVKHSINVIKTQQAAESLTESHFTVSVSKSDQSGIQESIQEAFSQSKLKSVLSITFSR